MVQLIAAAALGAVVWVGYSELRKHLAILAEEDARKAEAEKEVASLEKDPVTGRYRPKK